MADHLNFSAIYVITNTVNGKVYIGSAVNIRRRWNEHLRTLRLGSHHSRLLQRSWVRHGEESFVFSVVEPVDDASDLISREQAWIDRLSSFDSSLGYNINPNAKSRLGSKWTAERRAEFSASRKGFGKGKKLSAEHREALFKGKKAAGFSDETRRKMSESAKARVRRPISDDTKKKIGDANRGRKLPPVADATRAKLSAAARIDWQKRKSVTEQRNINHG